MKKFVVISTLTVALGASAVLAVRGTSAPVSPLAQGTVLDPFRLQVVTATSSASSASAPTDGNTTGTPTGEAEDVSNSVRPGPFTPPPRSPYAPPPR